MVTDSHEHGAAHVREEVEALVIREQRVPNPERV